MKTLFASLLLIYDVLGNPLVTLALYARKRWNSCVVADDMVCPRDDITFWFYTRETQEDPLQLDVNTLDQVPWVEGPLKFIVHGYSVDKDTAVNAVLRPAYFDAGDYNIISVDWSPLGPSGCYRQAVQNVPTIAKCVAEFFNAVLQSHQFSDVHLLGHSMGAHVAAWASEDIPGLPRLTKFDIANPFFNSKNSKNGTAGFIDVYLSNCGLKGQRRPSGDVNVYFNQNTFMPGCKCDTGCSHLRAVEYYAETIQTPMKAFPSGGWQDYLDSEEAPTQADLVLVGENGDPNIRGTFMAFTTEEPPFLLPDETYTNETSFNSFKQSLASECTIAYNYKRFIKDWFN